MMWVSKPRMPNMVSLPVDLISVSVEYLKNGAGSSRKKIAFWPTVQSAFFVRQTDAYGAMTDYHYTFPIEQLHGTLCVSTPHSLHVQREWLNSG